MRKLHRWIGVILLLPMLGWLRTVLGEPVLARTEDGWRHVSLNGQPDLLLGVLGLSLLALLSLLGARLAFRGARA